MSEYGTQTDGSFAKKPIDEILADQRQHFRDEIGTDIELRPGSPVAQILEAGALEIARMWDAAEASYYAGFYEDSFGQQLDKQLALAGFSRIPSRSATGEVEFTRADAAPEDITIPAGTVVTTERTETRPRIPFETTEGVVLPAGATSVTAPIEALKPWQTDVDEEWLGAETNVAANTVVRFQDPVSGVDDVTNPNPTGDEDLGHTSGRDRETDAEFKLRYDNTLAEGGSATVDAVRSGIVNADEDVVSAAVEEVRDSSQGYGFRATVLAPGVADATIAQAILESRAAGLESFGAQSGTATLDDGSTVTESFDRATEVGVLVDASITTTGTFPSDGQERIEGELVRYVGGVGHDGIRYPGLAIGEDVVHDQVARRVMSIQGVVEGTVAIGTGSGSLAESNVAIGATEAATTAPADITVTTS